MKKRKFEVRDTVENRGQYSTIKKIGEDRYFVEDIEDSKVFILFSDEELYSLSLIKDVDGKKIHFKDTIVDKKGIDYLVDKEVNTGRLIISNNQNIEDGSEYYLDESKLIFKIVK